jgi:hypothetical protein
VHVPIKEDATKALVEVLSKSRNKFIQEIGFGTAWLTLRGLEFVERIQNSLDRSGVREWD